MFSVRAVAVIGIVGVVLGYGESGGSVSAVSTVSVPIHGYGVEEHAAHVVEIKPPSPSPSMASVPLAKEPAVVVVAAPVVDVTTSHPQLMGSPVRVDVDVESSVAADRCDMECTKFDFTPVCATNGECHHQFSNVCIMKAFLCRHPDLGFRETKTELCLMHWLKRCSEKDLMS